MPCIKCGRKLSEGQVFCPVCQENAEKYPIKPGTPIQLPPRTPVPVAKARPKKPELSPEDRIHQLRSANRWLTLVLVVLLIAFVLMAVLILLMMERKLVMLPFTPGVSRMAALARQCFT